MKIAFFLVSFALLFSSYAHDENKAYFKITPKESTVEVIAEFPWAIRDALIRYNPELEHGKQKADFEKTLKMYVSKNFTLTSNSGQNFDLIQMKEFESKGHTHHATYQLIFNGKNLNNIKNTLLFEVSKNHENYHEVFMDGMIKSFITNEKQANFKIKNTNTSKAHYWWLCLLLIPIFYFKKQFKTR